jgi:hypothetical protein
MSPSRFVEATASLRTSFHRSLNACGGGDDESEREPKRSLFALVGRSTSRRCFSVDSFHNRIRWLSTVAQKSESKAYENRQAIQECMYDDEEEEEEFADDSSYYGEDCSISSDSIEEQEELVRMLYAELYDASD